MYTAIKIKEKNMYADCLLLDPIVNLIINWAQMVFVPVMTGTSQWHPCRLLPILKTTNKKKEKKRKIK